MIPILFKSGIIMPVSVFKKIISEETVIVATTASGEQVVLVTEMPNDVILSKYVTAVNTKKRSFDFEKEVSLYFKEKEALKEIELAKKNKI